MAHVKQNYISLEAALLKVADARAFQTKAWPSTKQANGGERAFEAQLLLVEEYTTRLRKVWNETPSYVNDGDVPNIEGRQRVEKYAAIVANLALWMVQAATGETIVEDTPTPLNTIEGARAFNDAVTMAAYYQDGLAEGRLTINDVRAAEGLPVLTATDTVDKCQAQCGSDLVCGLPRSSSVHDTLTISAHKFVPPQGTNSTGL